MATKETPETPDKAPSKASAEAELEHLKREKLRREEVLRKLEAFQKAYKSDDGAWIRRDRGRFFLLILMSLALTHLGFDRVFGIGQYFGLLSFLAPVPLSLAFLIYGNIKTLKWAAGLLILLTLGAFAVPAQSVVAIAYTLSIVYAYAISLFIRCDIPPIRCIIYTGTSLMAFLWATVLGCELLLEGGVQGYLQNVVEASLAQLPQGEQFDPQIFLDYLYNMGPIYITVVPFVAFWLCFFLVMRNFFLWGHRVAYSYSSLDLVRFRTSDYLLYPLAFGLGTSLLGFHLEDGGIRLLGHVLLGLTGVFYFFQGFGVFLDFLNHFKLVGILKSLLLVLTVALAQVWLAILGVFDAWLNLRGFLKKKPNQG